MPLGGSRNYVGLLRTVWANGLVAWHSGRTSVFGRRNFPILRSTCSWWMTTYVGKPSAIGQPTRPTQPFYPFAVDKWEAAIGCILPELGVAPSGKRLWRKGRHGVFADKTVWSMPGRFEICKWRYMNTLSMY